MREIVAAKIGDIITTDPLHIKSAYELDIPVELICRKRLAFMAAMDLGKKWQDLAKAPTLFIVDDQGLPQFIEGGVLKRRKEAT